MTLATGDHKDQMEILENQGWSAIEAGDWAAAEQAYDGALRCARDLKEPLSEASFRSYRGEARRRLGKLDEARDDLVHALHIAQAEECVQLVAHTQYLLAELENEVCDYSKAVERLFLALDAALACGADGIKEIAMGCLGRIFIRIGQPEAAHGCFLQALEMNPDGANAVAWLGNLGLSLAEMNDLEKSIEIYKKALEMARSSGDLSAQAKCLASEGLSHFQKEQYAEALECYKQALALSQQENDQYAESTWLGNLGNVYLRLGQPDKATALAEQGLELAKKVKDRHSEASHLDTLGDCFLERGELQKALNAYSSALEIGRAISDKLGERIYLANVARTYKRLGSTEDALSYFQKAIEIFDLQRSSIKADNYKTSFAATGQNLYRDTIQVCLESGRRVEALEYVGRAKSRALLDLLRNSPIDISELAQRTDDTTVAKLVARERELSMQIATLERIYWQGPLDTDPSSGHRGGATVSADDAPKLYSEWRDVVNQLKALHPNYANMVTADALGFDDLRKLWESNGKQAPLPAETAIVEFFLSDGFMMSAAICAGSRHPELNILLDSRDLAGLLSDLADFLEMSSTEGWEVPISLCKRLHQRLFGEICDKLPEQIKRLIIVPHGVLHRIPFAALHDGKQYLIERYSLSYLPSSSLIPIISANSAETDGPADALNYLVSAISDYSATREDGGIVFSSRLRSAAGLEDLSYTLEEGKTVCNLAAQHVPEVKLLTNEEVNLEGFKTLFSDYPVVHFAGHAVFFPEEPMASGLVLSDGSILTAARILHKEALRTKCGKLLVLSACQTGVNVITSGGEILGLARALMYAGMPNLILSLWEVADRSTAELMQDFHDSWQAGKTAIAEALAIAQRKAAREGQPIHAWAPFVHLGIE